MTGLILSLPSIEGFMGTKKGEGQIHTRIGRRQTTHAHAIRAQSDARPPYDDLGTYNPNLQT